MKNDSLHRFINVLGVNMPKTAVLRKAVQFTFKSEDKITVTIEDSNNTISLDIEGMDELMSSYLNYMHNVAQGNALSTRTMVFNQPKSSEQ